MPFGLREDLYNVTVVVTGTDGKKFKFVFDKMSGGAVSAKVTKYRAANGTLDEILLGGANSVGDITAKVLMTYDIYTWVSWLMQQNGKADAHVNKQPIDHDGNPFGKALTYKCKLMDVTPPDTDSESDNAALLSLAFSARTPVTTG